MMSTAQWLRRVSISKALFGLTVVVCGSNNCERGALQSYNRCVSLLINGMCIVVCVQDMQSNQIFSHLLLIIVNPCVLKRITLLS